MTVVSTDTAANAELQQKIASLCELSQLHQIPPGALAFATQTFGIVNHGFVLQ